LAVEAVDTEVQAMELLEDLLHLDQ